MGATPAEAHDGAEHTETKEEEPDATWEVQDPSYMPWESLPDGPGESGAPDASGGGPDAPDAADDAVDATDAVAGGGIIPAGGLAARPGSTKPPWRGGTWNAWGKSRGMGRGNGRGKGKGKGKGKPYRGNRGGRGRNEQKSTGKGKGQGKKRWHGDDDEEDGDDHHGAAASHLAHLFT